ncbi:transport protein [Klebsiella michiganensis]|nr:transport protein [Klebsiella michiganensis]
MLWFQDLMPGRAGAATTLFTNSISTGVILAGVIQGALSQSYGHASVYWTIARNFTGDAVYDQQGERYLNRHPSPGRMPGLGLDRLFQHDPFNIADNKKYTR